jgi:hypothetical protein
VLPDLAAQRAERSAEQAPMRAPPPALNVEPLRLGAAGSQLCACEEEEVLASLGVAFVRARWMMRVGGLIGHRFPRSVWSWAQSAIVTVTSPTASPTPGDADIRRLGGS